MTDSIVSDLVVDLSSGQKSGQLNGFSRESKRRICVNEDIFLFSQANQLAAVFTEWASGYSLQWFPEHTWTKIAIGRSNRALQSPQLCLAKI